jgi:hypothetical protein
MYICRYGETITMLDPAQLYGSTRPIQLSRVNNLPFTMPCSRVRARTQWPLDMVDGKFGLFGAF